MTPHEYVAIAEQCCLDIRRLRQQIADARDLALACPLPAQLRPATPSDMIAGAIIWYPHWPDHKWTIIDEVLRPQDAFKAFADDDGCRYGLEGAYIEVEA